MNLNNKKVLITGASGGIGSAICKKFLNSKAVLVLISSSDDKIAYLKSKVKSFIYKNRSTLVLYDKNKEK